MKKATQLCLYIACLLFSSGLGAQILHIQEIPHTQRDTIDIAAGGLPIVDINSQLRIRPDIVAIREAGLAQFPQYFQEDILKEKTARISDALANQDRILELTKQMLAGLDVQKDLLKEVERYLQRVSTDSLLSDDFNQYTGEYFKEYKSTPREQRPDRFVYSIERFNEQLEQIKTDLRILKRSSQIEFSIAAWRRDPAGGARIHVENFDRFENGEFYSVPRWVTTLSANDRQQLDNFQNLAQGLNTDASQVLDAYKAQILESFPSIECVQTIPAKLDSALRSVSADLKTALEQFKNGATDEIIPAFTSLRSDIVNWPVSETPDWKGRVSTTLDKLKALSNAFQTSVGDSILQANAQLMEVNFCLSQTITDIGRIQNFVQKFPYNYLHKVQLNSEDLAEEILAFKLNEIPPMGLIDLEYTGKRKSGDELLIKAVFRLPGDTTETKKTGYPIEKRRLKMVLIGAHSITKVGLILANSYTLEPPPDTPKFRFAPSAALLLKFGSRKSHFYNNFVDLGIGLNSAAPDFDLDGVPEFSVGLIGTVFRDIISVGWNWNFGLDKPNYFIGIHLPFNLPGVPVNSIQNNPLPED